MEPLRATDQTKHRTDDRFRPSDGEMGALRSSSASTSTTLSSLSSQVTALTDLVTSLFPARVSEPSPSPPAVPPVAPTRNHLWTPGGNRRCLLPSCTPGSLTATEGSSGNVSCCFATKPPGSGPTVPVSPSSCPPSPTAPWIGQWQRWDVTHECPPTSPSSWIFRRVFDHPTAGCLHSIKQGGQGIADYTLEFRMLAADSGWDDVAFRSAYWRGLSEEIKDLLVRDRLTSHNNLVSLAYQMDERLRERRLERAQRSVPGPTPADPRARPLLQSSLRPGPA